jgi:hypothetical protein
MFRKILVCPKNFWPPKMVHWPKFFWRRGGGGEVVKNNVLRKFFFGTKGTNNLQVFNHLNLAALHYGHPLTAWFVGKFYTHTPPCLNRLATALSLTGKARTKVYWQKDGGVNYLMIHTFDTHHSYIINKMDCPTKFPNSMSRNLPF